MVRQYKHVTVYYMLQSEITRENFSRCTLCPHEITQIGMFKQNAVSTRRLKVTKLKRNT